MFIFHLRQRLTILWKNNIQKLTLNKNINKSKDIFRKLWSILNIVREFRNALNIMNYSDDSTHAAEIDKDDFLKLTITPQASVVS
jgi:hypothetical protein